mgnify:CR=1 FL=1
MRTLVAWTTLLGLLVHGSMPSCAFGQEVAKSTSVPPLLFGTGFRRALAQRVSVSWIANSRDRLRQHTIREIAGRSQKLWQVSLVLDRRIDPSSELEIEVTNRSVREVLDAVARPVAAGVSVVGNTVYIGPAADSRVLRTLVHRRDNELSELARAKSRVARVAKLRREFTIRFENLTSPRDVLSLIARRWDIAIESTEPIPHDLWAGAELPRTTAVEALSLVLIQYGMTFRWIDGGVGIRILPPRRPVSLAGRYRARGGRVAAAIALVERELSGVTIERAGAGEVGVRGTYEELQVARALIERGRRPAGSVASPRFPPLSRRRFTLKVTRARVRDVMRQLEQTGVRFEFDAKRLEKSGIRFDQAVAVDVQQVTARVFLERLFGPLGLEAKIDGLKVRLRIKDR